jgi:predicted site-specific integrase-resolvase
MPNRRYDYNEGDVCRIPDKNVKRRTVIYGRVSTARQKNDMQDWIHQLKHRYFMNGHTINAIYSGTASGILFGKKPFP